MSGIIRIARHKSLKQPGIAIGPVLFIIAILAVLVAALAAGSGGFSSSTANDANRTSGGALIEQGVHMKLAFEKLYGGAVSLDELIISPKFSSGNATVAFFGSDGGGILPMSPPGSVVPSSGVNTWRFVEYANLPGVGSAGANDTAIVIGIVNASMCKAINAIIFGLNSVPATTVPAATSPSITLNDATGCTDATMATTTSGCNIAANTFDIHTVTGIADTRRPASTTDRAITITTSSCWPNDG